MAAVAAVGNSTAEYPWDDPDILAAPKLSSEQKQQYEEEGYLLLEGLIPPVLVQELQKEVERMEALASGLEKSTAVFDLEESHDSSDKSSPPRVRRVTRPDKLSDAFARLMRHPRILGVCKQLQGTTDLRHGNFKLNLKSPNYGSAVQWHQDWAFYPHTNQNLLAVGIMIDEVTVENAPLMVVPKSHKGPLFSHHRDGVFVGGVSDPAGLIGAEQLKGAEQLFGPAGSCSFHHARLLHGSDLNRSTKSRAMVFLEVNPADAWPLAPRPQDMEARELSEAVAAEKEKAMEQQLMNQPVQFIKDPQKYLELGTADGTYSGYPVVNLGEKQMLCGSQKAPRMEEGVPIRMPWPKPVGDKYQGSIYATQNLVEKPVFAKFEEVEIKGVAKL